MDWRELFMSRDQIQNSRLDELSNELLSSRIKGRKAERGVESLEQDIGLLILLQLVTLKTLIDNGLMKREDLHARLMEIDKLDGVGDGKVSPEALKRVLGLWMSGAEEGQGPSSVK